MKKFIVVFIMANGGRSSPIDVEAFGFKSAITVAMATWKTMRTSRESPVSVEVKGVAP